MSNHESTPSPRQYAEQILSRSEAVLKEAVTIAFPESPNADPLLAFPAPTEVRAESPDIPELTDERRAALLGKANELGFGNPEDVSLSEQGLNGGVVIVEGGQPHKMLAEAQMVVDDQTSQPKSIIISASPHRKLSNADEIKSAQDLFGRVGETEYDVAADVTRALPGFKEYPTPKVMEASYDINNQNSVSSEPRGQFKIVGEIDGTPVILMQINRRDLEDGKYDRQPNTAAVISIVNAITKMSGDETSPVVHVTSGTYRPSRAIGVALAGLSAGRTIGIATYGNDRLSRITGNAASIPENQLPGELHEMAKQSIKLREALNS